MSDHSLPKNIDPLKYADQAKTLEGEVKLGQLPRFSDMLVSEEGLVKVKLEFGRDEQKLRIVKGQLHASVQLRCERCLEPVDQEIVSDFCLGIVLSDEDAKQLPRSYEPLLVEPDSLEINELLEEELILSLPMFAYHEECSGDYQAAQDGANSEFGNGQSTEASDSPAKENPFSVLADFKPKKS